MTAPAPLGLRRISAEVADLEVLASSSRRLLGVQTVQASVVVAGDASVRGESSGKAGEGVTLDVQG